MQYQRENSGEKGALFLLVASNCASPFLYSRICLHEGIQGCLLFNLCSPCNFLPALVSWLSKVRRQVVVSGTRSPGSSCSASSGTWFSCVVFQQPCVRTALWRLPQILFLIAAAYKNRGAVAVSTNLWTKVHDNFQKQYYFSIVFLRMVLVPLEGELLFFLKITLAPNFKSSSCIRILTYIISLKCDLQREFSPSPQICSPCLCNPSAAQMQTDGATEDFGSCKIQLSGDAKIAES